MAKLIALASLSAVSLVIIGDTFAHRTTITTVVVDGEVWVPRSHNQRQRCHQQIQRQDFSHCERFLSQSMRSVLAFKGIENRPEKHLQECCQQLQRVDRQCQCEALEEVVRQQEEEEQQGEYGGGGRGRSQQVRQRARQLQSQCRLPERCDIQGFFLLSPLRYQLQRRGEE